jgi:hypothetical protein
MVPSVFARMQCYPYKSTMLIRHETTSFQPDDAFMANANISLHSGHAADLEVDGAIMGEKQPCFACLRSYNYSYACALHDQKNVS